MDFDLSSAVMTRDDVDLLVSEIDILIDSLYRTGDASYDNTIKKGVRFETTKLLATIGSSREERKANLEALKEKLQTMPIINLTLAFSPTLETVTQISKWVRKNINPNLALKIRTDSSIVAGAIIEYDGRYMDMSVAKKLDKALNDYFPRA